MNRSVHPAAADGTPGAEGLSGLAKAFFYAGARSLLVSHWALSSEAAVALTTRLFEETAQGASKAEALRRSMLALMQGKDTPILAHPAFWAPFVVWWARTMMAGRRRRLDRSYLRQAQASPRLRRLRRR